eukprot:symbB.v1.2.022294.t1/scaffold1969.1/size94314/8
MLDAIVSWGKVEEAVSLFEEWRIAVPPNTIIISNLIKGFAAQGDAERAMDTGPQPMQTEDWRCSRHME